MAINIYQQINRLIQYGLTNNFIHLDDVDYTRNAILETLQLDDYEDFPVDEETLDSPVEILEEILNWAAENRTLEENTVTYRDLLDTRLMGHFVPKPSEVIKKFYDIYKIDGPIPATKYLYQLSNQSHYIRTDRIAKNEHWYSSTEYGDLEITINLSKPEKDPKAIAAAKHLKESSYPNCLLCKENVGYAGRVNFPARQNLRTIPLTLDNEEWHIQFSPYVYYNEHAIVFKGSHDPMKISDKTFTRLLEFTEKFPHYFLGSNADLPIVGGSILSHDHFQGGYHDFPMAKAEVESTHELSAFPGVRAGIVKWPMSVVRLQGESKEELMNAAYMIFKEWKEYSDESVGILAYSGNTPHNTVTPIARRNGSMFELDLVLRNNRTNEEHPMGIFHPHAEVHHIKKENIGLIEVMGLAVLPGRLKEELSLLAKILPKPNYVEEIESNEMIRKHVQWAKQLKEKREDINGSNALEILKEEVGIVFSTILEHAGVFKRDDEGKQAFRKFMCNLPKSDIM